MKNLFNLKNKTVLVTGAAGSLADQYIDVVLKNEGKLVLIDINLAKLKNIKNKIYKNYCEKIYIFKGDVTKYSQILKISKLLKKQKIKIDVLINNAAINYKIDNNHKKVSDQIKLEKFSTKIWKKDLDVSLLGSLNCIKIFGTEMVKNKYGIILNIASDLSIIAPDNKISKLIPMGRLAKKNEYKSTILYLISDASSYMNGSVLSIDGGRTIL